MEDWKRLLACDPRGCIISSIANIALIIKHDIRLSGIVYNDMKKAIDIKGSVPWTKTSPGWNGTDFSCFEMFLEKEYDIYAPAKCRDALFAYLSSERRYHPVIEYIEGLKWDGKKRLEKLFIDTLGAEDNAYVRSVTRKTFVAAISRVYNPGIKFDNMLVLCGEQGIGKSTLIRRMAKEWYSDSMTISDMKDKTAAEKLQGIWITELGELAGLKKVDVETVKSFLSRSNDQYRVPYGTYVDTHPRSGILIGTTNAKDGFLRDITGNRRFWPVQLSGHGKNPVWSLTDAEIDQLWAESYALYKAGESLYLDDETEKMALHEQCNAMESDPREGLIEEYLELLNNDKVCLMQIWCECLKHERQDMKKSDAFELEGIMRRISSWTVYSGNSSGKLRIPGYGVQKAFIKRAS